uniref:Uncharacterized protein n=1 Tax=Zea mays TaxID=4577 RepID=C4J1L6_MAIZE|nr:unknown [Zea mays]
MGHEGGYASSRKMATTRKGTPNSSRSACPRDHKASHDNSPPLTCHRPAPPPRPRTPPRRQSRPGTAGTPTRGRSCCSRPR